MAASEPILDWLREHVRGFQRAIGAFLVLGLAFVLTMLLSFGAMALLVSEGATQRMDEAILLWMYDQSSPWLDRAALKITDLGSTVFVVVVAAVVSAFLWIFRARYSVLLLWVAMAGGAVLNYTLKAFFDRPRPELWERMYAGSASFPSGHAMSAAIAYGTLAYLVARLGAGRGVRVIAFTFAALLIVVVGLTRMYLGVHYPSDVIAGYVAGFSWAAFCALAMELVRYFRAVPGPGGRGSGVV